MTEAENAESATTMAKDRSEPDSLKTNVAEPDASLQKQAKPSDVVSSKTVSKPTESKEKEISAPIQNTRQQQLDKPKDGMTTIYKKEGTTKQTVAVEGVLAPVEKEVQEFKARLDRMPQRRRMAEANKELNLGRLALGNNQDRKAALHFWKSSALNPRDPHAYAWLVTTLVNMKAYQEARNTIERASRNGVSISQMENNIQFKNAYSKLLNH